LLSLEHTRFEVRDSNLLGTWSNTWAMPPVFKIMYSHLLSYINVSAGYLQLLRGKWWMRATDYGMEGRHWSIPSYLHWSWPCVMLFASVQEVFDVPAEEVLGQSSNIRITKMWMKDSVVLLHSLNLSHCGGCCTRIIN
jgi:hypothetical protein